jgi:four helix bundle protein
MYPWAICKENVSISMGGYSPPTAIYAVSLPSPAMRNDRENVIVDLTTKFALKIIDFSEQLEQNRKYVVAKQLLRSGTAIGALVREAQNAESKADFIHKFKIAAKEADETWYWLILCKEANTYPDPDQSIVAGLEDVIKIITKIIAKSKANRS